MPFSSTELTVESECVEGMFACVPMPILPALTNKKALAASLSKLFWEKNDDEKERRECSGIEGDC